MNVLAIIALILTPILWVLYHKFFHVVYFGNLGNHILGEILACFFVSIFLTAIVYVLGGTVLAYLVMAVLFLLKWILIIGVGIGVIFFVGKMVSLIGRKSNGNVDKDLHTKNTDEKNDVSQSLAAVNDAVDTPNTETMFCVYCGKKISRAAKFCNFCGSANTYKE